MYTVDVTIRDMILNETKTVIIIVGCVCACKVYYTPRGMCYGYDRSS